MKLPYSGKTTAYHHKHYPNDPIPEDTPKSLSKVFYLDVQWSDCPVEVEKDVKKLWKSYNLGNDYYFLKLSIKDLVDMTFDKNLTLDYLIQYLREQNLPENEKVIIHWWW